MQSVLRFRQLKKKSVKQRQTYLLFGTGLLCLGLMGWRRLSSVFLLLLANKLLFFVKLYHMLQINFEYFFAFSLFVFSSCFSVSDKT